MFIDRIDRSQVLYEVQTRNTVRTDSEPCFSHDGEGGIWREGEYEGATGEVADKLDRNDSPSRPLELNCTFMSLGQMVSNCLSKNSTTLADKLDHWAWRETALILPNASQTVELRVRSCGSVGRHCGSCRRPSPGPARGPAGPHGAAVLDSVTQ